MTYVIPLILIALAQYLFFVFRAGFARGKYGVDAPKISGNDIWERIHRVQINTMEQLIIFIPGMLIFSQYVSHNWVVINGVLFIIGRQIYSHLYIKDPKSRGPGAIMTIFTNVALIVGGLIGWVMEVLV